TTRKSSGTRSSRPIPTSVSSGPMTRPRSSSSRSTAATFRPASIANSAAGGRDTSKAPAARPGLSILLLRLVGRDQRIGAFRGNVPQPTENDHRHPEQERHGSPHKSFRVVSWLINAREPICVADQIPRQGSATAELFPAVRVARSTLERIGTLVELD